MIYRVFATSLICVLFSLSLIVSAAGDEFLVRTLVGNDTTPPTTPTNLVATPIATSQIDLTWSTSTDNWIFAGYQVFRDFNMSTTGPPNFLQIATTTSPNYSDVGLVASTTYSYFVTAFDSVPNYSASSTVVSTTTIASTTPPVVSTTSVSHNYGTKFIHPSDSLQKLTITPGMNSVLIQYETQWYIKSVIKWGKSISYELGSLAERSFSKYHETQITGLEPGTTYNFTIEGENQIGRYGTLTADSFTTLPPIDTYPPANVSGLQAYQNGEDIILEWKNPNDVDFKNVRVVRSDLFYPNDIADGWVIYEGDGEMVRDHGAARTDGTQFYTVFSYDEKGNISSGAVVVFTVRTNGMEANAIEIVPDGNGIVDTSNSINLSFDDLVFLQDGREISFNTNNEVPIDGTKQFAILIPYEKLPEHLKTILVTMTDSVDPEKVFTFLLRINTDKTAYQAILAPLGVAGIFPLRVSVFDFKTAQIGYTSGDVISQIAYAPVERNHTGFFGYFFMMLMSLRFSYVILFIIFLIFLLLLARRSFTHRQSKI